MWSIYFGLLYNRHASPLRYAVCNDTTLGGVGFQYKKSIVAALLLISGERRRGVEAKWIVFASGAIGGERKGNGGSPYCWHGAVGSYGVQLVTVLFSATPLQHSSWTASQEYCTHSCPKISWSSVHEAWQQ